MGTGRLEAFSDGVIAIIITIMVLELKVPHSTDLSALSSLLPTFLSYVLSFIFVGIYWNNHHHMMHASANVSGLVLWANLHLLFWLSLIPFVTGWMGENHAATLPTAVYGAVLFMCSVAYYLLTRALIAAHRECSTLARSVGSDRKGIISSLLYLAAIGLAFLSPGYALAIYVGVALIWFLPDRRIEHEIAEHPPQA